MLKIVLRKMLSKRWMVLALLVGNILMVGIACTNPMYSKAVMQRMLTRDLASYLETKNSYPGNVSVKAGSTASKNGLVLESEQVVKEIPATYGVRALDTVACLNLNAAKAVPRLVREDDKSKSVTLGSLSNLEDHITLVAGEMYSDAPDDEGVIDVIVSERGLISLNLLLGEVLDLPTLTGPDGSPISVRVTGVFKNSEAGDTYWVRSPSYYSGYCLMDEELFREYFVDVPEPATALNAMWYVILDYTAMRGDQAERMLAVSADYEEYFDGVSGQSFRDNFSGVLTEFLKTSKKVSVTLWILQAPIFMLLIAFVFMVAQQMLEMEQNEIAVIKSRGASRGQIISTYFIQSVLLAIPGLLGGLALGVYLCQVLGSANAFLEFVKRKALDVEVTRETLIFAGGAALVSVLAMVIPVLRYSKVTIVSHKQRKQRGSDTPMWQKLFLDVILLGVALYGLYSFNGQKDILAQKVLEGASLDPLLFFSSSLFMIGAGLLALRVIPLIVWLVFTLFKRWWSPALYASFLRVLRTRRSQGFITVFLVITIALGMFNAQAARTINSNEEDNIRYVTGADIVVQENWESNAEQVADDPSVDLMYAEPDYGKYVTLEGAQSVAKVQVNANATASVSGGNVKNVRLMAIDTKDFGETAWFKSGLNEHHLNDYLNAISQNARAVLVSRNFQTNYGLKLGDIVTYKTSSTDSVRGIIYGFVDYFPSYVPVTYSKGVDGLYKETDNYLIVAHLSQVQSSWGVTPYQVWIKAKDSSGFIYDFAAENGVTFATFSDVAALMVNLKNDPVLQGTNGILTVGFIVVLLLCTVGFLIYWILSIQSRALQFGIFRAMGMSMREVITMLINEHAYISGLSIAAGAGVGYLTAKLYMPLIQMAYAASDRAVPLTVVSSTADTIRLLATVGVVLLICLFILGALISRMKIAQSLKLGED